MPRSAVSQVCICAFTRHDDLVGGVDHLVRGRSEISPDGFDPIAAEQKLPALEVADPVIEGDQPAAFDQNAFHRAQHVPSFRVSAKGLHATAAAL
jgi:hypothetical protein